MAVTYESIQTAGSANGNVTVTKPTSLAVGDLMIAFISSATGGPTGATHAGPSGWTKIEDQVPENGAVLTVWAVIATSTQTAASDFTWTSGGTNTDSGGAILRFTSTNGFNSVATNIVSNSDTALTTTGVTTLSTSTMLILCGADEDSGATATFSAYSVANNNPVWTERADFPSQSGGLRVSIGIATAPYALQQATGSSSITSSLGTSDVSSALVAITEDINVTVSPAVISKTKTINDPTVSGDANVSPAVITKTTNVQDPTITTKEAKWVNESKTNTDPTIANESKS